MNTLEMRKVVVQQPQFMPWIGLWHKVLSANVYILYMGVKFDQYDHMHRVTLDGKWLTMPVEGHSRNKLIKDVKLADPRAAQVIAGKVRARTSIAPYKDRLEPLLALLDTWTGTWLHELSNAVFIMLMEALRIRCEVKYDLRDRTGLEKTEKLDFCLVEHMAMEPFVYLQGGGGRNYMNHESLDAPRETRFQKMVDPNVSPDSIVTLLAHDPHPLLAIRQCAVWDGPNGHTYSYNGELLS